MSNLVCNHCRAELTIDNIKGIKFDRTYEMVDDKEIETEIAYVECSRCGNITETDSATGDLLRTNLINMWRMYHYDILYNFGDIEDLLNNLSDSDKEKIKDCQFKVFEDCTDDDSGDVYCYIAIFKGDTEIGKIDMMCYLNTPHDIENSEELIFGELSYSYSYKMELNNSQEHHIECPNCHNKILGKYWLNVKYQGHDNYGDYEEDIYIGECPVCGELNDELPYTGIECQPDEDLAECPPDPDGFDNNKLYSADELDYLLRYLSDEDRVKVSDCQFKLVEQYPDDDSGDMYYDITVYRDNNEVGKIDMQYHSNTYWDLIDDELKTTNGTPYHSYTMTLNEDSKEDSKNPFDDTFGSSTNPFDNLFDNIKSPFDNIKSPFDDSKLRCKKCGKVFCSCNNFLTRRG